MRLQVNKEDTDRFVFPDWDKLPHIHIELLWTPACQDVALVDPRPPATLVLVGAGLVVRKVPLRDWPFENAHLSIIDHALLMRGRNKALLYDLRQDAVTEAPDALLQRVDSERAGRERVVQELKGESADWWIAPPMPEP